MDKGRNRQENISGSGTGPEDFSGKRAEAGLSQEILTLVRDTFGDATLGELRLIAAAPIQTLELPWRGNNRNISCIPPGLYHCSLNKTRHLIEIHNVPRREGIQIHVGNYPHQTHGCILVGESRDGASVKDSLNALNRLFRYLLRRKLNLDDFLLEITSCSSRIAEVPLS